MRLRRDIIKTIKSLSWYGAAGKISHNEASHDRDGFLPRRTCQMDKFFYDSEQGKVFLCLRF